MRGREAVEGENLGAWDITPWKGCLRGTEARGYRGRLAHCQWQGVGFHWKCYMQLTSTHTPGLRAAAAQQAVPCAVPMAQKAAAS